MPHENREARPQNGDGLGNGCSADSSMPRLVKLQASSARNITPRTIYVNPLDVSLLVDRGDGTTTLRLRSDQRGDRVYVLNTAIERVAARINATEGVA